MKDALKNVAVGAAALAPIAIGAWFFGPAVLFAIPGTFACALLGAILRDLWKHG